MQISQLTQRKNHQPYVRRRKSNYKEKLQQAEFILENNEKRKCRRVWRCTIKVAFTDICTIIWRRRRLRHYSNIIQLEIKFAGIGNLCGRLVIQISPQITCLINVLFITQLISTFGTQLDSNPHNRRRKSSLRGPNRLTYAQSNLIEIIN